ncbi:MAG: response regulator transcription factor [Lachnospiraceae bacterium]|nr:response regulator transcription factor [Lachnospiraceae bacterium]
MNSTILIVEDDDMINNMIKEAMENEGFKCLQAFSGTEGILVAKTENIDLVILDLMLPGKPGEEVIKEIKNLKNIPVIIVSAKDGIDSKVVLLRSGADDYLTKPFDIRELEVRVEVCLRKYSPDTRGTSSAEMKQSGDGDSDDKIPEAANLEHLVSYKEISLNPEDYSVRINENPIELTKHEFRILELLMKNPDRAFSKQAIYDFAWDDVYLGEDNTINVHVSNIRKKIKKYSETEYIETVWGIGFKLQK